MTLPNCCAAVCSRNILRIPKTGRPISLPSGPEWRPWTRSGPSCRILQDRLINSYPFHPDLIDRIFGKWVELDQFQRTRGVLQTFAVALRDAEAWDDSPLVGPQVLLVTPGMDGLSAALLKLAQVAKDSQRDKNPAVASEPENRIAKGSSGPESGCPHIDGQGD